MENENLEENSRNRIVKNPFLQFFWDEIQKLHAIKCKKNVRASETGSPSSACCRQWHAAPICFLMQAIIIHVDLAANSHDQGCQRPAAIPAGSHMRSTVYYCIVQQTIAVAPSQINGQFSRPAPTSESRDPPCSLLTRPPPRRLIESWRRIPVNSRN